MKVKINKILLVFILVWLCSATYSSYIASRSPSSRHSFSSYPGDNFVAAVLDKWLPGQNDIKARAAILADASTGEIIYAKNENKIMPVASITKLATALVFLNSAPDLESSITVTAGDIEDAGSTRLYPGATLTIRDCLHLCLMRSDNGAARTLAHASGSGISHFVLRMNELASSLDMQSTHFVDPTGRYAANKSTAADLVKLINCAARNTIISEITSKKMHTVTLLNESKSYTLYNNNHMLYESWNVKGGKTGYISQAGYCLALEVLDGSGRPVNAVVLGSPSNRYRYRDINRLLAYTVKE
jgi:D-alanyl-D-alanine endopeptidase (penicillin-binding protein 7)